MDTNTQVATVETTVATTTAQQNASTVSKVRFCGRDMTRKRRNWFVFVIVLSIALLGIGFALLYAFVINVAHAAVEFDQLTDAGTSGTTGLFVVNTNVTDFESLASTTSYTPSLVKWKFIAMYLAEDVDSVTQNNIGNTEMLWLNADCKGNINTCNADNVNTWFDFSAGLAAVNRMLNSQGRSVKPGTYKYIRMEFCKGTPSNPNFEYQAGDMTAPFAYVVGVCGLTSKQAVPPMVIKGGQSVTVKVSYSLANSVSTFTNDCGAQWGCVKDPVQDIWYQMDYNRMNFLPSQVIVQ
eukprot:TRINITY_DN1749_c0_g1_i1.p1 TRINITY_DN1749_c0_g1~~TRINITY_DN1749_c0_g1_i1.p1  ORF type:complete len:295 (-),score=54.68 TRINITY_DN1749_c0_g1_i1:152-1036(-)